MPGNDRGNRRKSEEDADDLRLMQLVGRGDTGAFEQLIEKHQALVAGTVARMLGGNSDVEDIAQQVFIRVWKSARRYVPRARCVPFGDGTSADDRGSNFAATGNAANGVGAAQI